MHKSSSTLFLRKLCRFVRKGSIIWTCDNQYV